MIRLQEIQEALLHLVGWTQNYDPQNQIDNALTESESGLTFQGAHPLVTLENIANIMPDSYLYVYPDWVATRYYHKGSKVKYQNKVWIANEDSINVHPEANDFNQDFNNDFGSELAGKWVLYNMFSDYVTELTKNGINTAIQSFIMRKQLNEETKSLVDHRTFFDGAARLQSIIDPRSKIVGFEIIPVRAMGVTTKIERIGLQMRGAVGNITLYLFHSSQAEPIKTLTFNYTNTSGAFQWFTPEEPVYLPYIGTDTDAGGAWFLCYNQDELPDGMRALNVAKDWSAEPCQTCLGGSIEAWKAITKYLQVSPFSISAPEGFTEQPELFDIGTIAYTNTVNYGMNVEVSIGCDLTDFIIQQRNIFATLIQKQVAVNVLRTIAMNPDVRVNRNQVNVTREEILFAVDGPVQGRPSGLAYELEMAYKALSFDTKGLSRICLKCNTRGVSYGHV